MTTPLEDSRSLGPRGGALLVLIVAIGVGMYFLGHRSRASAQGEGQTAQATLDAVAPPPGAGKPVGAATSQSGRHLAPHDTFYLLQYVSAKTASGVIGFEPGQQVRLVEVHQPTQTLVVGDGQAQVEVGPDKLTNDMDIAALVRQKDQTNQAKIAAYVQAEQKAYDDAKRAAAVNTEKDMAKVNKEERDASVVSGKDSTLNQPATDVTNGSSAVAGYGSGYGYAGSAGYGSPYSYFSGAATTATTTGSAGATGSGAAPAAARGTAGGGR